MTSKLPARYSCMHTSCQTILIVRLQHPGLSSSNLHTRMLDMLLGHVVPTFLNHSCSLRLFSSSKMSAVADWMIGSVTLYHADESLFVEPRRRRHRDPWKRRATEEDKHAQDGSVLALQCLGKCHPCQRSGGAATLSRVSLAPPLRLSGRLFRSSAFPRPLGVPICGPRPAVAAFLSRLLRKAAAAAGHVAGGPADTGPAGGPPAALRTSIAIVVPPLGALEGALLSL